MTTIKSTPSPMPIGTGLRNLRELAGMTLTEAAAEAVTTVTYLAHVESGVVTPTRSYVARVTQTIATRLAA